MPRGLHWFRNDLRLQDNTALAALAARADQWLPVFVLDRRLLGGPRAGVPRARFLLASAYLQVQQYGKACCRGCSGKSVRVC